MDIPVRYMLSGAVSESLTNTLAWLLLATLLTFHRELAANLVLEVLLAVFQPISVRE
jgi:hypothetical protein